MEIIRTRTVMGRPVYPAVDLRGTVRVRPERPDPPVREPNWPIARVIEAIGMKHEIGLFAGRIFLAADNGGKAFRAASRSPPPSWRSRCNTSSTHACWAVRSQAVATDQIC